MDLPDSLTDRQRECVEAYFSCDGSEKLAAEKLDIDLKAVRNHLWYAHLKGVIFTPDKFSPVAPAGWECFFSTVQHKNGEVVQQWDRVKPALPYEKQLIAYLKARTPVSKIKINKPKAVDSNIQLEWTLADYHYGMLAWDKETGEDYDINIARELLLDSASTIFHRAGKVKETVLVLMGDNFHTDFKSNHTEKSKHPLSVDSRYPKMVLSGVETFISAIEICLQFSANVKVIVLYGNHDAHTSVNLQYMLHFHFHNVTDRVKVDLSPSKEHYNFFGSVASMYHHGDGTKPDRLCAKLMRHIAKNDITGSRFYYVKQAHLHKEDRRDINGTLFEIVPSPVAPDGHAGASAYESERATVATMYHKDYGELYRIPIMVQGLKWKKEQRIRENGRTIGRRNL